MMREFIDAATAGGAVSALTSAYTGQIVIAEISLFFMVVFGIWGAWIKWRDSKAFREALKSGDLQKAIEIKRKR